MAACIGLRNVPSHGSDPTAKVDRSSGTFGVIENAHS